MRIETLGVYGINHAMKGMRNPMDSWHLQDTIEKEDGTVVIGSNDLGLAQRLLKAGNEHAKFMRQIHVWADVDMPRYWWSEQDTYKFGSKNSCSTMHKLLNKTKPITLDMFVYSKEDEYIMKIVIERLNEIRSQWIEASTASEKTNCIVRAKRILPEGLLQLRTWDTNYAEIRNIYHQRKNHRLKEEWVETFCSWCETLPYFEELIAYKGDK